METWKLEFGDIGGPWLTLVGRNQMINFTLSSFTSRCSQSTSIFRGSSLSTPRPKPMKEYISLPEFGTSKIYAVTPSHIYLRMQSLLICFTHESSFSTLSLYTCRCNKWTSIILGRS